ncbi:trichohyalin [Drosophila eugracilis]|uniref:trichohyalin n=1 Tax=Drosophila eugracilis TaxID=29029 RepID=UPI001BDB3D92|nr:trichohyalin [Drosophila eugracilis]
MANVKTHSGSNRQKKSSLEDPMERGYRQKMRIIRGLTVRQASAKDLDLCAKWMYVFSRATKEESSARDYLLEQMLRQLQESGQLSLPFTNLANCSLELHMLLDEEGRQRLRHITPPQLVAPKPSSSSLMRRRLKSTPFEWRRRMLHLDHLEDQYWREEQTIWSPELSTDESPKPQHLPKISNPRNRGKTIGIKMNVSVLSPRVQRDLCERERKQHDILKRRERDRVDKELRDRERDRQKALLAQKHKMDRQKLEKDRQLRDRQLQEQQKKVKERRDYERYLLLKKREKQSEQEQRALSQRRPITPSSQDVEMIQQVGQELKQNLEQDTKRKIRHVSQKSMNVLGETDATQSERREQQFHLRAENIKRKVLAYEQLKEYHRRRARAERERQLRKRAELEVRIARSEIHVIGENNQKAMYEEARKKKIVGQSKEKYENHLETDGPGNFERKSELELKSREQSKKCERTRGRKRLETDQNDVKCFLSGKEKEEIDLKDDIERKRKSESKVIKERQERNYLKLEKDRKHRDEIEKKQEHELKSLKERQEREEFERKVLEKLETEKKEREDFEKKRQEELKNLKERQEREEFERKELEKRLDADKNEKADLERKREQELKDTREREEFEQKVLQKLENERKEREEFERKTREERELEEKKIDELKIKLNEVQERENKRNEERKKREFEKKEQEECERLAKEEEHIRKQRVLEKLKRNKCEREEMEKQEKAEDLKRQQIIRRWLQMEDQEERKERDHERQKRIIEECKKKIQDSATQQREREENYLLKREKLIKDRQEMEKLEEECLRRIEEENQLVKRYEEEHLQRHRRDGEQKDRTQRHQQVRQAMEREHQIERETREVAKKMRKHLEMRLELHQKNEVQQNKYEEIGVRKSESLEKFAKSEDQKTIAIRRSSKVEAQNALVEKPPGDMAQGSTSKDGREEVCDQPKADLYQSVGVRLNKLQESNSKISEQVQEQRQVLQELRLEAGEQNPLNKRISQRKSIMTFKKNNGTTTEDNAQHPTTQNPMLTSSHEYFQPGSLKSCGERWSRFIGSEDDSEAEDSPIQRNNCCVSSSSENNSCPEPCYSLVGSYCPVQNTYTVVQQSVSPSPYGNTEQQKAYGSYVRNRVAEWRKKLRSSSYFTENKEPEQRERAGREAGDFGLTYSILTGKKRYPQIKTTEISPDKMRLTEDHTQQRRVLGQLLGKSRTFDYHPDILAAENCLLKKKLSEARVKAKNKYVQEAIWQTARNLISVFQNKEAYTSSEDEGETLENEKLEQIYLQETKNKMNLPRPVFKMLMEALFRSNVDIPPNLMEKISVLDIELEMHVKKICNRIFARKGEKLLWRKADQLMDQQRHWQSCRTAEMYRDSDKTLRQWSRLTKNSMLRITDLFHDFCDMNDPLSCLTLQTVKRLYTEWQTQRFSFD